MNGKIQKLALHASLIASLLMTISSAAYSDAQYNSCFATVYSLFLCPFNVVILLPIIFDFVGFIITWRHTKSLAMSFFSAAVVSYIVLAFFALFVSVTTVYLSASLILTVCWIAAFAYELYK